MGAPDIERAQAVARAEGDRGEIAEPGDQDDRRPRGQVQVIGQKQAEKSRAEGQRTAAALNDHNSRAQKRAAAAGSIINPTAINVPSAESRRPG